MVASSSRRSDALRGRPGFALVSALLITTLVMIAAGCLLSVAASSRSLSGADADALRARTAAEEGITVATEALRWGWAEAPESLRGASVAGGSYEIEIAEVEVTDVFRGESQDVGRLTVGDNALRAWRVTAVGRFGGAERLIETSLVAAHDALPRGVSTIGDTSATAPLELRSCGLYAGGDVIGRENIRFPAPAFGTGTSGDPPPDLAYGGLYDIAAVHARGQILREGAEVHESGSATQGDDDRHTLGGPPGSLVAPLPGGLRAALETHATDPGVALRDTVLRLDLLPPHGASRGSATEPAKGLVIVIDNRKEAIPLIMTGDRTTVAGASPLTILVSGDCVLGQSAGTAGSTSFEGSLVVEGRLVVSGATTVLGGVRADRLLVEAPLIVSVEPDTGSQKEECAPGASNVHAASWSE